MKILSKNTVIVALAAIYAIAMVIFPEVTEIGSKTAIILWANSIVPVLLPFFIFSEFIKKTGNLQCLPRRVYPFVIGFLSGYPMGAKMVGDLVKESSLSKTEGKWVLSYSLITGPAFILFAVAQFIGSSKGAVIVLISHYLGALFNGLFHYKEFAYNSGKTRACSQAREKNQNLKRDYMENFTSSVFAGFRGMAMVLAYLMVFTIGVNMLEHIGIFSVINNQLITSISKGIFEMTLGINLVGMCNVSIIAKTISAAALVSFGGLSVIGQSVSMARGSGLGIREIFEIKLTHGIIAAIIATLLTHIMVI
jgi:hypothetical protein